MHFNLSDDIRIIASNEKAKITMVLADDMGVTLYRCRCLPRSVEAVSDLYAHEITLWTSPPDRYDTDYPVFRD